MLKKSTSLKPYGNPGGYYYVYFAKTMKNKTVAGILALVGGYVGVHRFYLGEVGRGIGHIFFLPIFIVTGLWAIPFIIGFIDGARFLSMSNEEFDKKYNGAAQRYPERSGRRQSRRERHDDRRRRRRQRYEPAPIPTRPNARSMKAKSSKALKRGIERFRDFDLDEALKAFSEALEGDPQNAAVHFNLACTHSLLEHKDKGFYHLDRAVALGLDDFEILKTRDHLAYLRVQDEWQHFAANGFRLAPQLDSPKQDDDLLSSEPTVNHTTEKTDLLAQLQQLASLKEKGLLTEEEFRVQKEKLLR
jgi:TM2 domain-containing membrane protein YozV